MYQFNEMDQITDKVFLGDYTASLDVPLLKQHGIKKVLTVSDYEGGPKYDINEFTHKRINIYDVSGINIIQYFGECLRFMEGNEKILVHCMAGASRSATIVIAYLMWSQKWKYADALSYVQKKRPLVCPNDGFKQQLQIFEKLLANFNYDIDFINFQDIIWYY